ncbi:SRPBCC family protein [Cohnella fermenti]|uniref:SRPBCC family protein n=1 Tax=Cohnella fermenti TaxID=2565925 RepID=A0A4S4BTB1_9BACL|nr:SRPBCC family protein [Cohnella fermenti]THF77515.1 SRPBCC family protein [Cohnella fermenti]
MGQVQWAIESVTIERLPSEVYDYASNPANFAEWAVSFCRSVRQSGGQWRIETPEGELALRFAEPNPYGILDHYVRGEVGPERPSHARVVSSGAGSRVIFTVFRAVDPRDRVYALDCRDVKADLLALKRALER